MRPESRLCPLVANSLLANFLFLATFLNFWPLFYLLATFYLLAIHHVTPVRSVIMHHVHGTNQRFCALKMEPLGRVRELFEAQLHLQGTVAHRSGLLHGNQGWARKLGVLAREQDTAQQYAYLNSDEMVHAMSSAVALWANRSQRGSLKCAAV